MYTVDSVPPTGERSSSKEEHYRRVFSYLHSNRSRAAGHRKNDEEFYFGDVERTRTQFNQQQLSTIEKKYDIPISTKINYAIIEQLISFLTGTQPYLRVIANEESNKQWAYLMERLQKNIWEEGDVAQKEFAQAIRDMLVVGSGHLLVRKNNFFEETTFGVAITYVPWTKVFVDPASEKPDFSDARTVCVAEKLSVVKAERKYGVSLNNDDISEVDAFHDHALEGLDSYPEFISDQTERWKEKKWVWCKEFYEAEEQYVYITPEGFTTLELPRPTQIPNPERQMLQQHIQALAMQLQEAQAQVQSQALEGRQQQDEGFTPTPENQAEGGMNQIEAGLGAQQLVPMQQQLQAMTAQMQQLPSVVPAYTIILESGREQIVQEVSRIKQRRIVRTLQIGKKILEQEILPTDQYPLHHFSIAHFRSPNRTFGITHFIKDIVKAMNKFWGLMIYELQLNSHGKWIASDTAVTDPRTFEKKAAVPGAVLQYTPDPSLTDGGKPELIAPQPLHQGIVDLLTMLLQLAEYVTGIFGVMQGNADSAPATMGATQSLQSFGTQRIKLAARSIEAVLSDMSYSTVRYVQKYCPREVLAKTIEVTDDETEAMLLDITEQTKFKCRTSLAQNLPTSRQMASVMLSTLAGQLADPLAQQLLTQYAMKFLDIQEADEIYEQLQVVKQMEGQMQQQAEQIKNLESQLKAASNNLAQKDVAMAAEKAKSNIDAEERVQTEAIKQQAALSPESEAAFPLQSYNI